MLVYAALRRVAIQRILGRLEEIFDAFFRAEDLHRKTA